jgi:hypothetical protein
VPTNDCSHQVYPYKKVDTAQEYLEDNFPIVLGSKLMNGGNIDGIQDVTWQIADPIEKVISWLIGRTNDIQRSIVVSVMINRVAVCA